MVLIVAEGNFSFVSCGSHQVVEAVEALAYAVEHVAAFVRKSAGELPVLDPQAAFADGLRERGVGGVAVRHRQSHQQRLEDGGADRAVVVAPDRADVLQTQRPRHLRVTLKINIFYFSEK